MRCPATSRPSSTWRSASPHRDELELIGTHGRITIPDPWIRRFGYVEPDRHGHTERLPADPTGKLHLAPGPDSTDAYRLEFAAASHAIETGDEPPFGRAHAIAQAATIEAVHEAVRTGARGTPAR